MHTGARESLPTLALKNAERARRGAPRRAAPARRAPRTRGGGRGPLRRRSRRHGARRSTLESLAPSRGTSPADPTASARRASGSAPPAGLLRPPGGPAVEALVGDRGERRRAGDGAERTSPPASARRTLERAARSARAHRRDAPSPAAPRAPRRRARSPRRGCARRRSRGFRLPASARARLHGPAPAIGESSGSPTPRRCTAAQAARRRASQPLIRSRRRAGVASGVARAAGARRPSAPRFDAIARSASQNVLAAARAAAGPALARPRRRRRPRPRAAAAPPPRRRSPIGKFGMSSMRIDEPADDGSSTPTSEEHRSVRPTTSFKGMRRRFRGRRACAGKARRQRAAEVAIDLTAAMRPHGVRSRRAARFATFARAAAASPARPQSVGERAARIDALRVRLNAARPRAAGRAAQMLERRPTTTSTPRPRPPRCRRPAPRRGLHPTRSAQRRRGALGAAADRPRRGWRRATATTSTLASTQILAPRARCARRVARDRAADGRAGSSPRRSCTALAERWRQGGRATGVVKAQGDLGPARCSALMRTPRRTSTRGPTRRRVTCQNAAFARLRPTAALSTAWLGARAMATARRRCRAVRRTTCSAWRSEAAGDAGSTDHLLYVTAVKNRRVEIARPSRRRVMHRSCAVLAHHIARAAPTCKVVSVAARNAIKVRQFSGEVVTLEWARSRVMCVAAAPDGRVITGSNDRTVKVWRDGACERTIQAHTGWTSGRWRCCRAERASSAARTTHREAVDARRRSRAHLRGGRRVYSRRGAARRRAAVVGTVAEERTVRGPAVPRRRDARPHLRGAHRRGERGGGDARRPAHHQRLDDKLVKVWSVASKSLVSTCAGHTDAFSRWRRCPTASASSAARRQHRPRVAPRRHPREHLRAAHRLGARPRGAARQPARALRLGRQDRQALQRQRRRRPAHLQAPHDASPTLPGAAARRPPSRRSRVAEKSASSAGRAQDRTACAAAMLAGAMRLCGGASAPTPARAVGGSRAPPLLRRLAAQPRAAAPPRALHAANSAPTSAGSHPCDGSARASASHRSAPRPRGAVARRSTTSGRAASPAVARLPPSALPPSDARSGAPRRPAAAGRSSRHLAARDLGVAAATCASRPRANRRLQDFSSASAGDARRAPRRRAHAPPPRSPARVASARAAWTARTLVRHRTPPTSSTRRSSASHGRQRVIASTRTPVDRPSTFARGGRRAMHRRRRRRRMEDVGVGEPSDRPTSARRTCRGHPETIFASRCGALRQQGGVSRQKRRRRRRRFTGVSFRRATARRTSAGVAIAEYCETVAASSVARRISRALARTAARATAPTCARGGGGERSGAARESGVCATRRVQTCGDLHSRAGDQRGRRSSMPFPFSRTRSAAARPAGVVLAAPAAPAPARAPGDIQQGPGEVEHIGSDLARRVGGDRGEA